jgi:hypothetical protein
VRNVSLRYAYQDGRFDAIHSYDTDVGLEIFEFASVEKAQAYFRKKVSGAIPEAKAKAMKATDFNSADRVAKKLRHANGSEIVVTHSGYFKMYDGSRGSNLTEDVRWVDGVYYFQVSTSPMSGAKGSAAAATGYERAEEFAIDYLAALGQPVTAQRRIPLRFVASAAAVTTW